MSDSSEDEDISKFKEAVDNSFVKLLTEAKGHGVKEHRPKSERYLEESGHYNDIKVPEEMQKRIGAKVSAIINKNIQFVDVENGIKKRKIKGGVKLFKDSEDFLSCEEPIDNYTVHHNSLSKKLIQKRRLVDKDGLLNEDDKMKSVTVSGEYILSKNGTKWWKSRRKEKLFKYKTNGKSKVLTAIE